MQQIALLVMKTTYFKGVCFKLEELKNDPRRSEDRYLNLFGSKISGIDLRDQCQIFLYNFMHKKRTFCPLPNLQSINHN